MTLWTRVRSWLRAVLHRQRTETEMDAELRFHLDAYAEDLLRAGVSHDEAHRRALLEFGGLEQTKEHCRDATGTTFFDSLLQDLRFAVRMLRKSPGFTAVAVATLAFGIGANTAIFTVINAVLLRTLPVQHPEELVVVGNPARVHSWSTGNPRIDVFSFPLYREIRDSNSVFSSVLASSYLENLRIKIEGGAENINGRLVTENYFETLRVSPLLGRTFSPEDGKAPGSDPVAVISYSYWQRRFAGDPTVLGRKIRLNNYPFTIIGVAPPGFFGEVVGDRADVWAPMMMQAQILPRREFLQNANISFLLLIGRLKPGVSLEQARANVNAVVEQGLTVTLDAKLSADDRDEIRHMKMTVPVAAGGRGLSRLREDFAMPLLVLMAMVLLVLLVACVNVANLMLARSATRQREIAIRFAMGAGAGRIVRQLLTESLVLALLGGALGLLVAQWGSALLVSLVYGNRSASDGLSLAVDWRVLAFTSAICFIAAMVFGLAPALRVLHVKLERSLKEGGRDFGAGSKGRVRYALAASQIALAVLVLMAASLLVRSLRNLEEVDLGYSRDQLLIVPVDLVSGGYRGAGIQNATRELLLRLENVPGVRSVSASSNGLFNGNESSDAVLVEGSTRENQDSATADDEVGPNYFSTIGAPIVVGREITQDDFQSAARVAVVNESFANFYLAGRNPIGRMVHIQDSSRPNQPPYQIVGVCRDVHDHDVRGSVRRRIYAPLTSADFDETDMLFIEIRAVGNREILVNSVRSTIREMNVDLTVGDIETGGELVTDTLGSQVLVAKLSMFFGGLVLLLVCVGLYGSMAYNVAARTKEIGLRIALGAPRGDLIWMVMRETWMVVAIGVSVGIPVGIAATELFRAMLFNVSKSDPASIGSAILALVVICVTAAVVPVRRATRVDPMVALRYE